VISLSKSVADGISGVTAQPVLARVETQLGERVGVRADRVARSKRLATWSLPNSSARLAACKRLAVEADTHPLPRATISNNAEKPTRLRHETWKDPVESTSSEMIGHDFGED
jgi:hypothetical protein